MSNHIVIAPLGQDPHTQGLFKFARVAREAGFDVAILSPGAGTDNILSSIQELDPRYVGFSYRLSASVAVEQMTSMMKRIEESGQLRCLDGAFRCFAFAGLPSAVAEVEAKLGNYHIFGISQSKDPLESVERSLVFLGVTDTLKNQIVANAQSRLNPPRIGILDQITKSVVADETGEAPLPVPSAVAQKSYVARIRESWPKLPILRTHYGEPGDSIDPTVRGVEELARARAIDEISLGSSDLSQRYYGMPNEWTGRENDGGVPYKSFEDLVRLREAARCGNYPAIKPYSHVTNMEAFVDDCLKAGMLIGSHQAVPLFWFNKLDGRGSTKVEDSIEEHARVVAKLARHGIPVEMNDPNHWSSRWASDAVVVADYGLIASVMVESGVKDMVLQLQFNKPRETSDYGDIAKFLAALDLVKMLLSPEDGVQVWVETRTGIEQFEPDLTIAKFQLVRSTLLQMMFNPHAMHLVSFCEALYAARPADIIASSRLVRKAVRAFQEQAADLMKYVEMPEVQARRESLRAEASYLLSQIAGADINSSPRSWRKRLASPKMLYGALTQGIMTAPGIFAEPFRALSVKNTTDVTPEGFIDAIDPQLLGAVSQLQTMMSRSD